MWPTLHSHIFYVLGAVAVDQQAVCTQTVYLHTEAASARFPRQLVAVRPEKRPSGDPEMEPGLVCGDYSSVPHLVMNTHPHLQKVRHVVGTATLARSGEGIGVL